MWRYNYIRRDVEMKRLSFEEVKKIFEENGCVLLTKEYKNNRQKLKYICICGRESEITFDSFKNGQRCKDCYEEKIKRKYDYTFVKNYLKNDGYILITTKDEYSSLISKIKVSCPNGHVYTTNFNNFKNGNRRCRECKKPIIEEIRLKFENEGYTLLETKYKNQRTKMMFICNNGHQGKITYNAFQQGQRCRECAIEENTERQRFSYEYVKNYFNEQGCKLLSKEYTNSGELLDYICLCGNISKIRFNSFKNGVRCKECGIKKVVESRKYSYEEVKSIFESRGCILLSTEYLNNHQKLHYICSCGNEDWKSLYMFIQGQSCYECGLKKLSNSLKGRPGLRGEESPHWKPEKTMEERINHRDLPEKYEWRKQVFERDYYTCQCCGDNKGGNLNAHHLDGYDWCKVSRWDIENGITLCKTCHDDFHNIYGNGSNTKEQFEEYMEGISWNCKGIYDNLVI
jgi:hypothetical protein